MQKKDMEKINTFIAKLHERSKTFIGYPAGRDFDYSELYSLMDYPLNNVGDPLGLSHSDMHSKDFEKEVISFFAELFSAPENNWWGYVTNGGSEGNLYALYLARELYPNAMVYYSEATHYSVQKNIHLLNMESIVIRAKVHGEMDYEDLQKTVEMHRHRPVVILANIGTTMTEAKDDVELIRSILNNCAVKNLYIHCDAALAGIYLALLQKGNFNFKFGADSIAVSGHKFIGSPIPCGVVLVKKNYKNRIGRSIPYIGTLDTTITGSRNGITPVFLWYAIKKMGIEGLRKRANECMDLASYAVEELIKIDVTARRNENALTVVFPQPAEKICWKWQLASENELSHLICMPGVTKGQIDLFIQDLDESNKMKSTYSDEPSNYYFT